MKQVKAGTCCVLLLASGLMAACSDAPESSSSTVAPAQDAAADAPTVNASAGRFTVTLGERSYDVAVECAYLDKHYFQFKSDKGYGDTNGRPRAAMIGDMHHALFFT